MKTVFPATYSTLSPEALATLITEKYCLEDVRCKLLVRGVGDTYLINTSTNTFILRAYRSSHRSFPQIQEEIDLLLAAQKAGVNVSYPIIDRSGHIIQRLDAVEGERNVVLFSFAPGQVVKQMNTTQLRALGHEMARLHHVASQIPRGTSRWNFDLETTLFQPLEMLAPVLAADQESYNWLKEVAMKAAEKLSSEHTSQFSSGYCHFDFLPKNFHFENDKVTLFDFDFVGYGWLVNDIMTFWQHLQLDVLFANRLTQEAADEAYNIFLDAYREYRPISEEELAAVPYLSLGFWLFYKGFHTTHDQFHIFNEPGHLKPIIGYLRKLVDTHWR
ncbi:MAG: phosphotransferase [Chitinophaga sp.]|uniref:phosphotransferase enzyme family protein n=1 Tax=Chitinophaga sp. TaxID=1869181 RepID=UPI0025C3E948|nr:phosphotransferase [Chitinophaga sp.]MBV8251161.1 phosphotransferase [Chitinophaga sp.]